MRLKKFKRLLCSLLANVKFRMPIGVFFSHFRNRTLSRNNNPFYFHFNFCYFGLGISTDFSYLGLSLNNDFGNFQG